MSIELLFSFPVRVTDGSAAGRHADSQPNGSHRLRRLGTASITRSIRHWRKRNLSVSCHSQSIENNHRVRLRISSLTMETN